MNLSFSRIVYNNLEEFAILIKTFFEYKKTNLCILIKSKGRCCVFNGKIHLYVGVALWLMMAMGELYLNPIMFLLGSVLPDADHPKALIGKIIPLHLMFRHRGFTHTVWFMIVCFSIGSTWNLWAGMSLSAGIFLHLMLDSCTPSGVRWFGRRR